MTPPIDDVMLRFGEGLLLAQQGERDAARALFTELWQEVGPEGDAFHRCAVAHAMADVQDDPHDELRWDLHALAAADLLTDDRVAAGGVPGSVAGLYPSLHLNLADVYLRLGHRARAGEHIAASRAALGALPDDGYRQMIVGALERIAAGLGGG